MVTSRVIAQCQVEGPVFSPVPWGERVFSFSIHAIKLVCNRAFTNKQNDFEVRIKQGSNWRLCVTMAELLSIFRPLKSIHGVLITTVFGQRNNFKSVAVLPHSKYKLAVLKIY
jgi:hypothetical protein